MIIPLFFTPGPGFPTGPGLSNPEMIVCLRDGGTLQLDVSVWWCSEPLQAGSTRKSSVLCCFSAWVYRTGTERERGLRGCYRQTDMSVGVGRDGGLKAKDDLRELFSIKIQVVNKTKLNWEDCPQLKRPPHRFGAWSWQDGHWTELYLTFPPSGGDRKLSVTRTVTKSVNSA